METRIWDLILQISISVCRLGTEVCRIRGLQICCNRPFSDLFYIQFLDTFKLFRIHNQANLAGKVIMGYELNQIWSQVPSHDQGCVTCMHGNACTRHEVPRRDPSLELSLQYLWCSPLFPKFWQSVRTVIQISASTMGSTDSYPVLFTMCFSSTWNYPTLVLWIILWITSTILNRSHYISNRTL